MSIEFRCSSCGKLLRTPPGTEGKQAKCPQCGLVQEIPSHSAMAPPPRDPDFAASRPADPSPQFAPPPPEASDNAYRSPTSTAAQPTFDRGFHPTCIDLGETFSRTWQIYRDNLGAVLGGALLTWIVSLFFGGIIGLVCGILGAVIGGDEGRIGMMIVQNLLAQVVGTFFYIGLVRYMLRIARGEPAEIGLLFSGGPLLLAGVVVQLIIVVATFLGFLALVIPGIIVALMLSQSMFILVDQGTDISAALRLSMTAMRGNKLSVFALYMLTVLLGLVVALFTCGIGAIFVGPFFLLLTAVVYLGVTGQKTVLDGPATHAGFERGFSATGAVPPPEPGV